MQITRSGVDTQKDPVDGFTGDVHIATQQNDESGSPVSWGEHVTGSERGAEG